MPTPSRKPTPKPAPSTRGGRPGMAQARARAGMTGKTTKPYANNIVATQSKPLTAAQQAEARHQAQLAGFNRRAAWVAGAAGKKGLAGLLGEISSSAREPLQRAQTNRETSLMGPIGTKSRLLKYVRNDFKGELSAADKKTINQIYRTYALKKTDAPKANVLDPFGNYPGKKRSTGRGK